jgi:acetolactate synthase-1/2/3 large subunit
MRRAFEELQSGRPRPVEIEMPMDVMGDPTEIGPAEKAAPPAPPAIDDDLIRDAAKLLSNAKRR